MRSNTEQSGQVLPVVTVAMVLVGVVCLGLGRLGGAAVARAQASTAADAAALAGAAEGKEAAVSAAEWNGGRLLSYEQVGADTRVQVELGGARAVARARRLPGAELGGGMGGVSQAGLHPAMQAALARATQLLGRPVPLTSGFRSRAQQEALYARRASNPYPVARPGTSRHERGLAVDVPLSFVPALLSVGPRAGLCQPYPRTDPVHFELCTSGVP